MQGYRLKSHFRIFKIKNTPSSAKKGRVKEVYFSLTCFHKYFFLERHWRDVLLRYESIGIFYTSICYVLNLRA